MTGISPKAAGPALVNLLAQGRLETRDEGKKTYWKITDKGKRVPESPSDGEHGEHGQS